MSDPRNSSLRIKNIYSTAFLALVFSILVAQLFVPEISLNSLSESYSWRKSLIEGYRKFKFSTGDKVYSDAVVGKDGWFFYTGEMSLRNYQKNDPLNISNIKKLTGILNQIDSAVNKYGGTFLVAIPPDKSTVYPQYMPDEIPVIGEVVSLDRLVERVDSNASFRLLDLRPALIKASQTSQVYYKTDSHWNCFGAYYAYKEIMTALSVSYPGLRMYVLDDFKIAYSEAGHFDIAKMIGAGIDEDMLTLAPTFTIGVFADPNYGSDYGVETLQVAQNADQELPNLVIFHDSFYSACLNEFVEPSFSRTVSVPYKDIELNAMLKMIAKEHPDVVIVEFVERFMDYFLWHLYE